jgi:hypothetical protein
VYEDQVPKHEVLLCKEKAMKCIQNAIQGSLVVTSRFIFFSKKVLNVM